MPVDMTDRSDLSRLPKTLLIDEAAARLGVSRRTIYYRISDGRLATIRTRGGSQRVLVSSIEELLRQEDAAKRSANGRDVGRSEAEPLTLQVKALPRNP
jgi:excisionase family DNA binding protein